jgi:hypothetical protein
MELTGFQKDRSLDELAAVGNVAQFVSFAPGGSLGALTQRFSRVAGFKPNHIFASPREALDCLLRNSSDDSINLRSFEPTRPQSRDFCYGIKDAEEALALILRLAEQNLYLIANETIDVSDGGVSGVMQGDVIEFAPDDTPRCVEKPGVASLPKERGLDVLERVYGFRPDVLEVNAGRLEFSIHPKPRGWRRSHTILWEYETTADVPARPALRWPNRFSRFLGDKLFGLLIGDILGLPIPRTIAFCRRVAPFTFGRPTGSNEIWIRTCPSDADPGRYRTLRGWVDPYRLMAEEDPSGTALPSLICQSSVPARFAGAAIASGRNGAAIIEGSSGYGDAFMLGTRSPETLPKQILADIQTLYEQVVHYLGPCRFEWVHDGRIAWIVQLHAGATESVADIVVPGDAKRWTNFDATKGLEELRRLITALPEGTGVEVRGEVGMTSHIADLLRKSQTPSRLFRRELLSRV